ncbi:amino acid adenylation domain-containing protein [Streptomyces sp. NPDC057746]|uniref:non-ribosomal peptide synthetase n=1 Tax=Streptomyces sp. NPDC057746 TaxID=3346237 RepID=UPI00367B3641
MTHEFPVSPAQEGLMATARSGLYSGRANVPVAFAVHGPFETEAFRRALHTVVARHEALRTVVRPSDAGPVQRVVPADAGHADVVEHHVTVGEVHDRMLTEAARPFDPASGPLLRAIVYRVADGSTQVLLVAHQLVCDGRSWQLLLDELSSAYTAFGAGAPWEPDEPAVHYGDFALWDREWRDSGGYTEAVAFWTDELRGADPAVRLPTDRTPPTRRTADGGTAALALNSALCHRLDEVSHQHRCTPFMTLFAAFSAFLGRLCATDDLIVGVPAAGRERSELQDIVGPFTTLLAVRADLTGSPTFADLMRRTRTRMLAGQSHRDAPYVDVVDASAPGRTAQEPFVHVAFAYEEALPIFEIAGADVRRIPLPAPTAGFDLAMTAERTGEEVTAYFSYAADLLDAATVRRWSTDFRALLERLLDAPDTPLAAERVVSADEQELLLETANRTAEAVVGPAVTELVAARAAERPDAVAVTDRTTTLTYRQLLDRADGLASHLRSLGVGPEVTVGLLLPRSAEMCTAALAVLRAGGAYVPLDPGNPPSRLAHMAENSAMRVVLAAPETEDLAAELGVPVLRTDTTGPTASFEPTPPAPSQLAYVIYTSGSTGTPKGIAVEHRALTNLAQAVRGDFGIGPDDRVLQYMNFGFDPAVSDLFFTWTAGAELHIATADERLGEDLLERLRQSRITYVVLPPTAALSVPGPGDRLPRLRTLAVGGEPCPAELVSRWAAPGRRVLNVYGPTETTVYSTTAALVPGEPVVLGRPVGGASVVVLDDRLRPAPRGATGEIHVAGANLTRGYVNGPAMTAERFVANPYGPPGSRMYRTGDLGRYGPDGELYYLGRVDAQVKVRGFRVELAEIESALATHSEVVMAAVAAVGGPDDRRLVAHVVHTAGSHPRVGELRSHLAERLPGYMVPEHFVYTDALPFNRSGKIDRARLPDPSVARLAHDEPAARPVTATEHRLAGVWSRVLGHDRIGTHDNFFDLGGNSLRTLAVLSALRAEPADGDTEGLALVDLFRFPTVAALAAHLDGLAGRSGTGPPNDDADSVAEARQRGLRRRARTAGLRDARSPDEPKGSV